MSRDFPEFIEAPLGASIDTMLAKLLECAITIESIEDAANTPHLSSAVEKLIEYHIMAQAANYNFWNMQISMIVDKKHRVQIINTKTLVRAASRLTTLWAKEEESKYVSEFWGIAIPTRDDIAHARDAVLSRLDTAKELLQIG